MVAVTETFPGVQPTVNQKSDSQAVPVGQEDLWWDAGDSNEVGQFDVVMSRMSRLQAMVPATATAGNNGKAARFTGINATTGLPETTISFADDLNLTWAMVMEKIEQGGDLNGTASGNNFMGVYNGPISGTFTAGSLYGLSSDGSTKLYISGAHPPVAFGLSAGTAYLDLGGRIRADNIGLEFNASGALQIKTGGSFGNTDINGTLTVSGGTALSSTLHVVGAATFSGTVSLGNGLTVTGAIEADTSYKMGGNVIIDSSGNVTAVDGDFTGDLTITSGMARLILLEDDAPSDEGFYDVIINAGSMIWRTRTDIGGSGESFMQVSRSGTTVSLISFANGNFRITDNLTVLSNFFRSVEAAVTAGTTQTQGGGQTVTGDIVEVSVVANANDTIVIPTAVVGASIFIKNNGANTMQIFPASGDDIDGTGVDAAVTLAAGSSVKYYAADATNWNS